MDERGQRRGVDDPGELAREGDAAPTPQEASSEAEAPSHGPSETIAGTIVAHLTGVAEWIARAVSPRPLASLYELHPEARLAAPRELGLRFLPLEDIRGTAVAGAAQRGEDFLPLPPFRGENWQGRYQRITDANERLRPLPPIDVYKYDGGYWVIDGHNRVGAARADRAAGLDAMVIELVPLDGQTSEQATSLLPYMGEAAAMRAGHAGVRPDFGSRGAGRVPLGGVSGPPARPVSPVDTPLEGGPAGEKPRS